jgi:dienelactone hydrolase
VTHHLKTACIAERCSLSLAAWSLTNSRIYRPTDLNATGAPLPVIVWANGGCVRFDGAWKDLLTRWAQAGFVVVAITTPTGADPLAAGMTTADDQALAIDWAYAENDVSGSPYAGHLDLSRIVAAGNSCGGITTLTLASRDDRVRSVFVLSGSSAFPGAPKEAAAAIMASIAVPVGFAVGGSEDIASGNAQQDFELLPAGVPGYIAHRSEGTHEKVSTDAGVLMEIGEISTNFIDAVGTNIGPLSNLTALQLTSI